MPVGKRTGVGTALACLIMAAFGSGTALASPAKIIAGSGFSFVGEPFEQPQGLVAKFSNPTDAVAPHNVFSAATGPDGGELFYSETIFPGSESPIAGTQYLGAGSYPFVCTLHPGMDGNLTITTSGKPVRRPSLSVTVPRQRLAKVARKGFLRLLIRSSTGARKAKVTVRVASKVISVVRAVTIVAGGRKMVEAKLTPKGKGIFRKARKSVRVSVTSSVDFGKSSTIRKVLS